MKRRAERMLRERGLEAAELSILLCGDETIHSLNREHRGKDRPTDVLAFAMQEGEPTGDGGVLGDIVISLPTAVRQAQSAGRPAWDEVTMLLAHGLLHLLGYDHQTDEQEREMTAETERLCSVANAPG